MSQAREVHEGGVSLEGQHEHLVRRGDIIGIVRYLGRTALKFKIEKGEDGEISIFATEIFCLRPVCVNPQMSPMGPRTRNKDTGRDI